MIWLASFPRSGNTFVRNIFNDVYGWASSAYHHNSELPMLRDYAKFPVVKTHLVPGELEPSDPDIRAIYLVRDGRDAVVSMAHQHKDFIDGTSDFKHILKHAILAAKGSYFGGWSTNVESWLPRADAVMRFEDLVADPMGCMEALRPIIALPEPDPTRLPTFQQMREGKSRYGRGARGPSEESIQEFTQKFFRKGEIGAWKNDMPKRLERLFWRKHGRVMQQLGYGKLGEVAREIPELPGFTRAGKILIRKEVVKPLTQIKHVPHQNGLIRNNVKLISIHIPKTAGTSFRNTLKSVYGDKGVLRVDINKRKLMVDEKHFSSLSVPDRVQVFHGHFSMHELKNHFEVQEGVPVITWLRDPVQRVVSNYYYLSSVLAELLDEENRGLNIISKLQRTLLEYAQADMNRNRISKFLRGVRLSDLSFVGIVDHMAEEMEALARLLKWPHYEPFVVNQTKSTKPDVDPELRDQIRALNDLDVMIYEEALELREKRLNT